MFPIKSDVCSSPGFDTGSPALTDVDGAGSGLEVESLAGFDSPGK